MNRIEFGELRIGNTARKHLSEVCDSNWASGGPKVKEFEKKWGNLFGYKHSVAMSSGTDAVINACLALYDLKHAKRGVSEVIVPALSFIATSNAVRAAGLVPRFVDVKKETLNIDEWKIKEAINENTVAIMPVHTMGRMAEMKTICEIAKQDNLIVIDQLYYYITGDQDLFQGSIDKGILLQGPIGTGKTIRIMLPLIPPVIKKPNRKRH